MVLFLLAVVWAIYLASWFRSRVPHRNVNSISSFSRHLSVLERTSPSRQLGTGSGQWPSERASVTPLYPPAHYGSISRRSAMSKGEARRRRRDVLYVLGGAALVTLLGAVALGGVFVWMHLLTDAALVAYTALLARAQHLASERRAKVRYLATPDGGVEPGYYLSQSASAR